MFGLSAHDFKILMKVIFAHADELERVILFGSRVRNNYRENSDIDLAIHYRENGVQRKTPTLQFDFESSALSYTVDLVDLALEKDTKLSEFVQKDGVVLYDKIKSETGDYWMTIALLNEKLADFKSALKALDAALTKDIEKDDLYLDATIQRFEFTYELCWKLMKAYLQYVGIEVNNPRSAIRESIKQHLIQNDPAWFEMIEKRNLTTHTYHHKIALDVYTSVKAYFIQLLHQFDDVVSKSIAAM